jgi:tetratricopeptide (TPR) repeat protein
LVLALIAFALVLTLLSSGLGAAEFSPQAVKPEPLPAATVELQTAITAFRNRDWNAASKIMRMLPQPLATEPSGSATPLRVWAILITQSAGNREAALTRWATLQLPPDTESWRHVAMAAAHLQQLQLDEAAASLNLAAQFDARNPLVRYYSGLYLLERAEAAHDWADASANIGIRLVAFAPRPAAPPLVTPNTTSMFRLAALEELEAAIAHQDELDHAQPLVAVTTPEALDVAPTVHDLLMACGGDRFVADAHSIVSYLHLEQGNADAAERHLDSATALGATVIYGYDDVARAYEEEHRYLSAARAAAKAVRHGPGRAGAAVRLLKNLGRMIDEEQGR